MKKRSKWVETEVEVEAQSGRLRTCIQRRNSLTKRWHTDHTTQWLPAVGVSTVTLQFLDVMAQRMADNLIRDIEAGPMHTDWRV